MSVRSARLPAMTLGEEVVEDYVATRLTLRAHPMALLRHILTPGTPPHPSLAEEAPAHVEGMEGESSAPLPPPSGSHPRTVDPFRGALSPQRSLGPRRPRDE